MRALGAGRTSFTARTWCSSPSRPRAWRRRSRSSSARAWRAARASCRSRRVSCRPTVSRLRSRSSARSGRSAWPASAAPRTRARWSSRGAGSSARPTRRSSRTGFAERVPARGRRVRGVGRPGRRRARRRARRTRPRSPLARPRRRASTRPGWRRATSSARWLALAERRGGRSATFLGRAGTGDLVATALAPKSRNRSAGELLSQGVPAAEIPDRLGQAVEALETVPLLARAIERGRARARRSPSALARLIAGELPLDDWIRLVRAEAARAGTLRRPRCAPGGGGSAWSVRRR